MAFLPITKEECVQRGWGEVDFVFITGDSYVDQLLLLQEADMGSKGTGIPQEMSQFSRIRGLLAEIREENSCLSLKDLAVNGHDLMALGITGKAIGRTLNFLLG